MTKPNEERGEFLAVLGEMELVMEPSLGKIKRVEAILGRPLIQVAGELIAGIGVTIAQLISVIDALAKDPKPKIDKIGKAVVKTGYVKSIEPLQDLIDYVLMGEGGGEEDSDDEDDEESEGNGPEGSSSDE